jgi:F-type H+-transporting ATPase subunit epsilon
MAENTFMLEVVTPERILLSDEVQFVVVPAAEGEVGVLRNHAPMVAGLKIGVLRYVGKDGVMRHMAVSGGFMEVIDNEAIVLAETAERGTEIDILRAKAAKERAERRLQQRAEEINFTRAQMALARALARIKAAESDRRM